MVNLRSLSYGNIGVWTSKRKFIYVPNIVIKTYNKKQHQFENSRKAPKWMFHILKEMMAYELLRKSRNIMQVHFTLEEDHRGIRAGFKIIPRSYGRGMYLYAKKFNSYYKFWQYLQNPNQSQVNYHITENLPKIDLDNIKTYMNFGMVYEPEQMRKYRKHERGSFNYHTIENMYRNLSYKYDGREIVKKLMRY